MIGPTLNEKYRGFRQYGATKALHILTAINLLNYADRYVPSAVKSLIQQDLHINDFESALPSTGMVIMYMISAVIFGTLTDKGVVDRRYLLCGGIIFWSIATALAGLSKNIVQLVVIRSLVGVGEGAYGTICPPMISDFFPPDERNTAFGLYYLALPLGGALGYGIGAIIGSAFGWRASFFACGIPGVLVAFAILRISNPHRGINDCKEGEVDSHNMSLQSTSTEPESASQKWKNELLHFWKDIMEIVSNKHFLFAVLGSCANNFGLGGLADWYTVFLLRYTNASLNSAGLIVGAITVIGGLGGTILGSKVADYFQGRVKSAYFLIPALFTLPAAGFLLLAINFTNSLALEAFLLLGAQLCAWTNIGPLSTIAITVIPPRLRSRSAGVLIFLQHALGDIISPPIIGLISDKTHSLRLAMQITWIAVVVGGVWWGAAYLFLPPLDFSSLQESASPSTTGVHSSKDGSAKPIQPMKSDQDSGDDSTHAGSSFPAQERDDGRVLPTTYISLLCGKDPLVMNSDGEIVIAPQCDDGSSGSTARSIVGFTNIGVSNGARGAEAGMGRYVSVVKNGSDSSDDISTGEGLCLDL